MPRHPPKITPESRQQSARHEAQYRLFRVFAHDFWRVADPTAPLIWSKHMEVICDEIQAVMEESDRRRALFHAIMEKHAGDERAAAAEVSAAFDHLPRLRICLLIPPRNSKSTIVQRLLPAWRWLTRPEEQNLVLSAVEDIIDDNGRALRDLLLSAEYAAIQRYLMSTGRLVHGDTTRGCPRGQAFGLRADQRALANFANTSGGGRHGYVISGTYVGVNADVIAIDDPHKIDDGLSETTSPAMKLRAMAAVRGTYKDTIQDRLISQRWGVVILIMQRVHTKDLADYFIEQKAEVVCLPSEYDPTHPQKYSKDWRQPGELLNPLRFGKGDLAAKKAESARGYATKEMMRPTVQEGVKFKSEWFTKRWTVLPELEEVILSVDAAATANENSDFCALHVWGKAGANRYLLDRVYRQMELPDLLVAFDALVAKWPTARIKLVENKSNGTSLISMRKDTVPGIVPINPKGDKEARAGWAVASYQAGQVWLPNESWVDEYVMNMVGFLAGAAHDDDVDATSQAMERWAMAIAPWLAGRHEALVDRLAPLSEGEGVTRWERKAAGPYRAGVVPGWIQGRPGSEGVAIVCDVRGRMVALVETTDGGHEAFVSAVAMELRYWEARPVRYAEVGPAVQVARGLCREGVHMAGRNLPVRKAPGEAGAGYRPENAEETKALWSGFLKALSEGRTGVRDGLTLLKLEMVTEDGGLPRMPDGSALSGRVLAYLLALGDAPALPAAKKQTVWEAMKGQGGERKTDIWSVC